MNYVTFTCVCCRRKWRGRVSLPTNVYPWGTTAICRRCNAGECERQGERLTFDDVDQMGLALNGCREGAK